MKTAKKSNRDPFRVQIKRSAGAENVSITLNLNYNRRDLALWIREVLIEPNLAALSTEHPLRQCDRVVVMDILNELITEGAEAALQLAFIAFIAEKVKQVPSALATKYGARKDVVRGLLPTESQLQQPWEETQTRRRRLQAVPVRSQGRPPGRGRWKDDDAFLRSLDAALLFFRTMPSQRSLWKRMTASESVPTHGAVRSLTKRLAACEMSWTDVEARWKELKKKGENVMSRGFPLVVT